MPQSVPVKFERYLALDIHKRYVVVGGVNAQQQVVLPQRRLDFDDWASWLPTQVKRTDAVVIEATTNAWMFYDQLVPYAGRVVVANPLLVKWIAAARVKTDTQDVFRLARLLAAELVPEVWVPPVPVRELRALLAHRRRLTKTHTMTVNRRHSLLHRYNRVPPAGELFALTQRAWWLQLDVSPTERWRLRQDLATGDHLAPHIAEVDAELSRLNTEAPWADEVPLLLQLPGFGLLTAMTLLAAIGDVTRFESAKKLVGYAGLGASVHDSGETHRTGHIPKQGRKEMRWVLVEAARTAVQRHPYWPREHDRRVRRLDTNVAVVAIARKLLAAVWHVLTKRATDPHADPHLVGLKFMA